MSEALDEDFSAELDTAYEKIDELTEKVYELNQQIADLSEALSEDSGLPKYTVQFVSSGTTVDSITASSIMYSPTTIKDNHNFVGWYYDIAATRPVQFPLSVNSDITLYAKFNETRESLANRFNNYVHGLTDMKLVVEAPILDNVYITTIGENIRMVAKMVYVNETTSFTRTESITYTLSFNYGKLDEATGSISYSIRDVGTGVYDYYSELLDIVSVEKIGKFYKVNTRSLSSYLNFPDLNLDDVHTRIETYFDYAISDLYYEITFTGYENDIFFYNAN